MDIRGNSSGSVANVTSLLARVAVAKNIENRELIREPVQKEPDPVPAPTAGKESVAGKKENLPGVSDVAPSDTSNSQSNTQTTGQLVDVSA